jgi:hypothetical protein
MIQSSDLQAFIDRHKGVERVMPPPAHGDSRGENAAPLRIPHRI